jgi:hypothetical protein
VIQIEIIMTIQKNDLTLSLLLSSSGRTEQQLEREAQEEETIDQRQEEAVFVALLQRSEVFHQSLEELEYDSFASDAESSSSSTSSWEYLLEEEAAASYNRDTIDIQQIQMVNDQSRFHHLRSSRAWTDFLDTFETDSLDLAASRAVPRRVKNVQEEDDDDNDEHDDDDTLDDDFVIPLKDQPSNSSNLPLTREQRPWSARTRSSTTITQQRRRRRITSKHYDDLRRRKRRSSRIQNE